MTDQGSAIFPRHLFWDVHLAQLDIESHKHLIIPRALWASTPATFEEDIRKLEELYSPADIVDVLKGTKELISNSVCALVAARYQVPVFYRFSLSV